MTIEPATPEMAGELARVTGAVGWEQSRGHDFDERHWRTLLAEPDRWTGVVQRDGRVVGIASVRTGDEPGEGHLGYLLVDPPAAGTGVGRELLAGAVDEIRHRGCARATLRVPDENERARRLYERNGWHDTGRRVINEWLALEMCEYELPLAPPAH